MAITFSKLHKMKNFHILSIFLLLVSCKTALINTALEGIGIYDKNAKVISLSNDSKSIICFPIHHIGTKEYYMDIEKKVDSLISNGYYVYYEGLIQDTLNNHENSRKFRKEFGFIAKNYVGLIKTKAGNNFEYKEEIIDQPKFNFYSLIKSSRNVDVSLKEIIKQYEISNGKIVLDSCDLFTPIDKEITCRKVKILSDDSPEWKNLVLDFRNKNLFEEIKNDSIHDKLILLYGKKHIDAVEVYLMENGYKKD